MVAGDPTKVKVGPGFLYGNVLLAPSPTDLVTPWTTVDPGWFSFGYTDDGSQFEFDLKYQDIMVAEEIDPVDSQQTDRITMITFNAAQSTKENITYAFNGGTLTTTGSGATRVTKFEPPALGVVTRLQIGWESLDHLERWVFYSCLQTAKVSITHKKAPNKATIPMSFKAFVPAGGGVPFKAIYSNPA